MTTNWKFVEIAEMMNISVGSASMISQEKFGMKRVFSEWVPRLLMMEQKQQRIDDSESCLAMFTRNKQDFLYQFETMGETWIHHFTLELNWQSSE